MYTVILAEDEPLALRTHIALIEKYCPNFQVVASAENGEDALNAAREKQPDLVISDIKMPLMTGVELAAALREELPNVCMILISGYTDFEYTQSAIRLGITDYLLKPVVPSAMKKTMKFAEQQIREIHYRERNRLLRMLGRGEAVDTRELNRYFPHQEYYAALIRRGGLPRRFGMEMTREIYSSIDEQYIVFGRDENEALYLIHSDMVSADELVRHMRKITASQLSAGYYTMIFDDQSFSLEDIQERTHLLYQKLDTESRVGVIQEISVHSEGNDTAESSLEERRSRDVILGQLEQLADLGRREAFETELKRAFLLSFENRRSQLQVEGFAHEVLAILRRHGWMSSSPKEVEYLLDELFYNAESMEEFSKNFLDGFLEEAEEAKYADKADSPIFFDQIRDYLERNLQAEISLQGLCDTFGISQTYMSRLFRKYAGQSFSKYLTALRMDRARAIFQENPDYFIKDVAEMVGYEDQFYFSRLFRAYTGKSPSQYMKNTSGK